MRDTSQKMEHKPDSNGAGHTMVNAYLRKIARDRAASLRWNTNALVLAYVNLTIAIILTLLGVGTVVMAPVAVFGLGIVWLLSRLQGKRLEKALYREEMHDYAALVSSAPERNLDRKETTVPLTPVPSPLTQSELKILGQMATGKINKEISSSLSISENTVKTHINNIYQKLEVNDRVSAVLMGMRFGWVRDEAPQTQAATSGRQGKET